MAGCKLHTHFPVPDEADRMKKSHRAGINRSISCLALAGLLVSATGCLTPWGRNRASTPSGLFGNTPAQAQAGTNPQMPTDGPSFASLSDGVLNPNQPGADSAPNATTQPASYTQPPGFVQPAGTSQPTGQVQQAGQVNQPAGQIPMEGVRQASGTDRYIARQVPSNVPLCQLVATNQPS